MIRATAFLRVIRKWNNADTDASARPCDAHSTRFAMKTATRLRTRPLAAALITGLGLGMHATGAFAATQIAVTTADDAGSSSTCTLRQAITAMNGGGVTTGTACVASTISGVDTITFDTTAFRRTARTRSRSRMRQQPLSITDANLVIDASANGNVTVQRSANAANAFGIFYASGAYGTLMIDSLTVANGKLTATRPSGKAFGAGIASMSTSLVLKNSTVAGNAISIAGYAAGGGVAVYVGDLTMIGSTVSGNSASISGSGIGIGGGIYVRRTREAATRPSSAAGSPATPHQATVAECVGDTLTMTNGNVANNSAWLGGGMCARAR
jgi:CSLREA domain-containing protein